MSKKNKRKNKSRFNSGSEEGIISNMGRLSWDSLKNDEQKRKEFINTYEKILSIFLEDVQAEKISATDAEVIIRSMESMMDFQLEKYPDIRRELEKVKKEKEQKLNLLGIYVS